MYNKDYRGSIVSKLKTYEINKFYIKMLDLRVNFYGRQIKF